MAQYKVPTIEPFTTRAAPFIVTTAYTNAGGYLKAEWFLVVPDDRCTGFAQRACFTVKAFPPGEFQLDEDLMLQDALGQAKVRLSRYLDEQRAAAGERGGSRFPSIEESDKRFFVRYWIHGECVDSLERIRCDTECQPLTEFLRWVVTLPKIERQDL